MVSLALIQSTYATLPALIPTTTDRIVVWGALALVIGMIAWREYRLPDVPPAHAAPGSERRSAAAVAPARTPPVESVGAPAAELPLPAAQARPVSDGQPEA